MFETQQNGLSAHNADSGAGLLFLDKKHKLVFKYKSPLDSYLLQLTFYEADNQAPSLLLAEIGNEYSWGNVVFSLTPTGVKEIGEIDAATIHPAHDAYDDISKVTTITRDGANLNFRFDTDSVIVNPGGRAEKVVAAKGFYYLYNGKALKAVLE